MHKANSKTCPLCQNSRALFFFEGDNRQYFHCNTCSLIFVASEYYLSPEKEKSRYDLHQNSPSDKSYRAFLDQLFIPLKNRLNPNASGLDFGSGPGPTLSLMFKESGHAMDIYDYFYAKNDGVFQKKYDFITTTETIEHLHKPAEELEKIWNCLKPGGWLGVMTAFVPSLSDFPAWHYKADPTHVCFFSKKTFEWLADKWQTKTTFAPKGVVLFKKPSPNS